jgi:hypothetical protein
MHHIVVPTINDDRHLMLFVVSGNHSKTNGFHKPYTGEMVPGNPAVDFKEFQGTTQK